MTLPLKPVSIVLIPLFLCAALAGCAATPEKKAAAPTPQPRQEVQKPVAPPPPENCAGSVETVVKEIDTTWYAVLQKTNDALKNIDTYLQENGIDLLTPNKKTAQVSRSYQKGMNRFGKLYRVISEYSLYCEKHVKSPARGTLFISKDQSETILQKLADFETQLSPFKSLPAELDTLFKKIKNL